MRSVLTSAVLATALFGQAFGARGSPHRHGHQHLHVKKAEEFPKRAVGSEVVATIDGQVVSWVNEYSGESTSAAAATSVAAASTTAAAVTTKSAAAKVAENYIASSTGSAAASSSSAASTGSAASSDCLSTVKANTNIITVDNPTAGDDVAIGLGSGGAFEFEVTNSASEDIVFVLWSSYGEEGDWVAQGVQATAPNLTFALGCGESQLISFNPSLYTADNGYGASADANIAGAFSVLTSSMTASADLPDGYIKNTWGEFNIQTKSIYSTLDVSRMLTTSGHSLSIELSESKGSDSICVSNMTTCVFMPGGLISGCAAGTAGTDSDASGLDGGCMFGVTSGYAAITISDPIA